jgi:glycosyltransferase involved in cell wall biosynthesis
MTFSIVIPTYNRADLLKKCLDSLVVQTDQDFEVLVCDNGSTDHTEAVVSQYKNKLSLHYFSLEPSGTPARPRNIGIQNAKGEWICFLDSDDWWYPRKLEKTKAHLANSDLIYHPLDVYFDGTEKAQTVGGPISLKSWTHYLVAGNSIPNSAVAVRKQLLFEAGPLDERREIAAVVDFDLWLRVRQKSNRFYFIKETLGGLFVSKNSAHNHVTQISKNQIKQHRFLLEKYLPEIKSKRARTNLEVAFKYTAARIMNRSGDTTGVREYLGWRDLRDFWNTRYFLKMLYLLVWSMRKSRRTL